MAKRKPTRTLHEMEMELGYQINSSIYPAEAKTRFYSDLSPIPDGIYDKTKREFEELKRRKHDLATTKEQILTASVFEVC